MGLRAPGKWRCEVLRSGPGALTWAQQVAGLALPCPCCVRPGQGPPQASISPGCEVKELGPHFPSSDHLLWRARPDYPSQRGHPHRAHSCPGGRTVPREDSQVTSRRGGGLAQTAGGLTTAELQPGTRSGQ